MEGARSMQPEYGGVGSWHFGSCIIGLGSVRPSPIPPPPTIPRPTSPPESNQPFRYWPGLKQRGAEGEGER